MELMEEGLGAGGRKHLPRRHVEQSEDRRRESLNEKNLAIYSLFPSSQLGCLLGWFLPSAGLCLYTRQPSHRFRKIDGWIFIPLSCALHPRSLHIYLPMLQSCMYLQRAALDDARANCGIILEATCYQGDGGGRNSWYATGKAGLL